MAQYWFNTLGPGMPKQVASMIEQSLRWRIDAGEWSDSLRLPDERSLAAEYGVARNTIRAAIDRIGLDGGVRREVGRGTFLRPPPGTELTAVLRTLVGASPADTMAVRLIIEPKAAALAATNGNLADLDAIAAAHAEAAAAEAFELFEQCDGRLHELIFVAARNELLTGMHAILKIIRSERQWLAIKRRSFSAQRRADYCAEHAAIVQALLNRDADAAERTMQAHLETVRRNLLNAP